MYVIGTAGHVDHGKSVLVQALTGIDPDRLPEEKERGMTIDLGFAWLKLPGGQEVSIVDVPGHERFIKNMLAGVGGIDLALLVIAADEGVMPQTREHLAILDLLRVKSGVLAITKKDLVNDDWLEMVAADAMDAVKGTALAGAPLVTCSGATGEGLDELRAVLERELAKTPPKRDIGRPRLSIDRVFTVAGFGTVVTGTLLDGSFRAGQEVEVVPGGLRARIRGLQTHARKVDEATPGSRTAINLSGIAADALTRGQVVALPGTLVPTTALDVHLRALPSLRHPIRHNARVSFHSGASEVWGKIRLLERDELGPGEEGWAQVRLDAPVAVLKGDLFVVRDANDTLGGGEVVETQARRHRRRDRATVETLAALQTGSPSEALLTILRQRQPLVLGALLKLSDAAEGEARTALNELVAKNEVVALGETPLGEGTLLFTGAGFAALGEKARGAVSSYYREHPLRRAMPKEELRSRLGLDSRVFNQALKAWLEESELAERGAGVGLSGHEVKLSPNERARADAFLEAVAANPYAPPTDNLPDEELLAYLEEEGLIIVAGGVAFAADAYRQMLEQVLSHLRAEGRLTLAQARDMFSTSRKYVQALLEHLDEQRITQRVGDERVLREAAKG
jgi:selenocysteine-specific elongation factor